MGRIVFLMLLLGVVVACGSGHVESPATAAASATPTLPIGVSFITRAAPTVAVIQTTPTPLPTPTPTPTPTPIIYTIAQGDTLLGIALQQGATVEEIEARNPGIQPELLQIGQRIELPPPATAVAQQYAATPMPLQVSVSQIYAYYTPVGSLWLLGEVVNEGDVPAENVRVEIQLLDETGSPAGTAVAWVAVPVITAGDNAPFAALVNDPPATLAQPVVAVVGGQSVQDLGTRYLELVAEDVELVVADEGVELIGRVRNTGAATATQIRLVATLYDSQGQVSGYQQITVEEALAPGETASFTTSAAPPGGRVADYHLSVQAMALEE